MAQLLALQGIKWPRFEQWPGSLHYTGIQDWAQHVTLKVPAPPWCIEG